MKITLLCLCVVFWLTCFISFSAAQDGPQHDRRVVCYMAAWGVYLAGKGKFDVPDAAPAAALCTHIVYVFLSLDGNTYKIRSTDPSRDLPQNFGQAGISKTVNLKKKNPHLKVMIGVGGWNDGSINYSNMVSLKNRRNIFIKSVMEFLKANRLDGLDINWQFPGDRGGSPADKANFVSLVREMRQEFDKQGYILSLALSSFPFRISLGTDPAQLSRHVHFINILSYEYHGFWESKVGIGTPLHANDELNLEHSMNLYKSLGAPPDKLNMGLSGYGMTFYLNQPANSTEGIIGQSAKGFGFHGPYNEPDGFIAYNEVCAMLKDASWQKAWHETSQTPYAVNGERVMSYDNPQSMTEKVKFAMEAKLGGVLLYGLEKDDFRNDCELEGYPNYPLLRSIDRALTEYSSSIYNDLLDLFEKHNAYYFWNGMNEP